MNQYARIKIERIAAERALEVTHDRRSEQFRSNVRNPASARSVPSEALVLMSIERNTRHLRVERKDNGDRRMPVNYQG
ncbi:hypothetical protein PWR63_00175 [Paraburkholderia sp. A2WS-5]|uniref:hypothetical protein n=1 Tax=unclassified Paraburkholderia TaxID=2615204 RepID=UPI003B813B51